MRCSCLLAVSDIFKASELEYCEIAVRGMQNQMWIRTNKLHSNWLLHLKPPLWSSRKSYFGSGNCCEAPSHVVSLAVNQGEWSKLCRLAGRILHNLLRNTSIQWVHMRFHLNFAFFKEAGVQPPLSNWLFVLNTMHAKLLKLGFHFFQSL